MPSKDGLIVKEDAVYYIIRTSLSKCYVLNMSDKEFAEEFGASKSGIIDEKVKS